MNLNLNGIVVPVQSNQPQFSYMIALSRLINWVLAFNMFDQVRLGISPEGFEVGFSNGFDNIANIIALTF